MTEKIMKLALLFILGILTCTAIQVFACDCQNIILSKESLRNYEVIFAGQVISKKQVAYTTDVEGQWAVNEVLLKVDKVYKGDHQADTLKINTAISDATCGYNFETGKKYIVYSFFVKSEERTEKILTTNSCTPTKHFNKKEVRTIKKYLSKDKA